METDQKEISKYSDLNDFASLLLANGYVIIHPSKPSSYFHFFKDGAMGYVQNESLGGGVSFSSNHKPCKEAGTGYSVLRDIDRKGLTLENAEKACKRIIWPEHSGKVKFWESPDQFINADSYNKTNYTITK